MCINPALLAATKVPVKCRETANPCLAVTTPPQKHPLWLGKGLPPEPNVFGSEPLAYSDQRQCLATRSIQLSV